MCFPRGEEGVGAAGDPAWAAAAVLRGGEVVATAVVEGIAGAPYEPGLLALREGPVLEAAVRALAVQPDILIVNATGRDHPRRAGLALHLGAVLDVPSVGVTDRQLYDGEDARWAETRRRAKPLLVHGGWRTDKETAMRLIVPSALRARARTPEPLRRARELARRARSSAP